MTQPTTVDPTRDSVRAVAAAIRAGKLSATECLAAVRARIDELNPTINAIVTFDPGAETAAAAADRQRQEGAPLGPLHGVPFTVKDTLLTEGLRTTAGSPALATVVATGTATAVARLQAAGAILVGKTNCSEFAVDTHTGNDLFGDTRNPLDPTRSSGGSSGGEAAAVAAGFSTFGVGTDFGGSIRWPAHCTGIASIRPTVGLVPGTGCFPFPADGSLQPTNSASLLHQLMTIGPITRHAGDLELLLEIMAGPDGTSPTASPVGMSGSVADVDLGTLRVAWADGEGTVPVRKEIVRAVADAAGALAADVAHVVEAAPPGLDRAAGLFIRARTTAGMPEVLALVAGREHLLGDWLRDHLAESGAGGTVSDQVRVAEEYDALRAAVLDWQREHPILLLPVASVTAPPIGTDQCDVDGLEVPRSAVGSSCRAISILALPSAVVRIGEDANGMPIGVQVVGRPHHDHEVLAVAERLEQLLRPDLT